MNEPTRYDKNLKLLSTRLGLGLKNPKHDLYFESSFLRVLVVLGR